MPRPAVMGLGAVERITARFTFPLLVLGIFAFALKAWVCICLFPIHAWNDVRLRPSFLIADGLPLYPGLKEGLITTWMYGPVQPLLFYPVTFTHDIVQVFFYTAVLNVLLLATPLLLVCVFWNSNEPDSPPCNIPGRLLCGVAALLLLPVNYLKFVTADNPSLAFGLGSIALFSVGLRRHSRLILWLAAFAAATAAFSKVHGLAVGAGEILWLIYNRRLKDAAGFLLQFVVCMIGWTLIGIALSNSPRAFWEHIFVVPSQLPWFPDIFQHAREFSPWLALAVLLPAGSITFLLWKGVARRPLGIPIFIWLMALPITLAATFKFGGSTNSLHPVFYLVPFILLEAYGHAADRCVGWRRSVMGLLVLIVSIQTIAEFKNKPLAPVMKPCIEARDMAQTKGDTLWLPWRPLAAYLATGHHYHDEDGLHVRQISGLYPSRSHAYEAMPGHWTWTAVEVPGMTWEIASVMQPGPVREERQGIWVIYSSPDADLKNPPLPR